MREFKRKKGERRPIRLIRGTDGRLRTALPGVDDIGDIWAEQRRIRLQEAIEEDKRRAAKAAARKARLRKLFRRDKTQAKSDRAAKKGGADKAVEVQINRPLSSILPKLFRVKRPRFSRKQYGIGAALCLLLLAGVLGLSFFKADPPTDKDGVASETLGAVNQKPQFKTILPLGKSIGQLGGWARVSPPDKDPVFAYVDEVDSVRLRVSQQELPESFKKDTAAKLAELAAQFNANKKLAVGDTTVYVGTSIKGPQSVVLSKKDLLILINSDSGLTDKQWNDYIWLLQ